MNVNYSRTYSVCVSLLYSQNSCHFCLKRIMISYIVCVFFLFGFVAAEISNCHDLAYFVGKQSFVSHPLVSNETSSASFHTTDRVEQVFCWLVADSLGEPATNGYPRDFHAKGGRLKLFYIVMLHKLYNNNVINLSYALSALKMRHFGSASRHSKTPKTNGNPRSRGFYPNVKLKHNRCCKTSLLLCKFEDGPGFPVGRK